MKPPGSTRLAFLVGFFAFPAAVYLQSGGRQTGIIELVTVGLAGGFLAVVTYAIAVSWRRK